MSWFDVDKEGLAKILEKRGKAFAVFELIQNAWDEDITNVDITLEPISNRSYARLIVTDDNPEGFQDLTHAYTLFAESKKKSNPDKRGVFNLGEKLVLSLCESATISTTKGTVIFEGKERHKSRKTREVGSEVNCIIKMSRSEYEQAVEMIQDLIPPQGIVTTFNGEEIKYREPLRIFKAQLDTIISDDEGYLKHTRRKTGIEVHEVKKGDIGYIYEMGIPVVDTGDYYHINVMQKVPMNMNRDNVTPAYLKTIRVFILNEMYKDIPQEEVNKEWVKAATDDERCNSDATITIMDHRFGKKRVAKDKDNPESDAKAFAAGNTVVDMLKQCTKQERKNIKSASALALSSVNYPTKIEFDKSIPPMKWDDLTKGMQNIHDYAIELAKRLLRVDLKVYFLKANGLNATYEKTGNSTGTIVFYVDSLEKNAQRKGLDTWFDLHNEDVNRLIIHELGHHAGHHLEKKYHDALCNMGARLVHIALEEPELFKKFGYNLKEETANA